MPTSYQGGARRVNVKPPAPISPPGDKTPITYDRNSARPTATFVPYFWEAYNEIVEPRLFDRYLLRKWYPDLGAHGFAIVKLLRDRCYFNPATGQRRDVVELRMDELAGLVGISRSMLFKVFSQNTALSHFVRRIEQYQFADGKPRRDANLYQVCMDEPVHPDDMQRYDDLRAIKESERDLVPVQRVYKGNPADPKGESYESTKKTHRTGGQNPNDSYESTEKTHSGSRDSYESTTRTADTKYLGSTEATVDTSYLGSTERTALEEDLPFGNILTSSLTPAAESPHKSPPGEGESVPADLAAIWPTFLDAMAQVMTTPTFHTHIKTLIPNDLAGDEIVLLVPTAFTREWIEKRHRPAIESALSAALGRRVNVRLTQIGKLNNG